MDAVYVFLNKRKISIRGRKILQTCGRKRLSADNNLHKGMTILRKRYFGTKIRNWQKSCQLCQKGMIAANCGPTEPLCARAEFGSSRTEAGRHALVDNYGPAPVFVPSLVPNTLRSAEHVTRSSRWPWFHHPTVSQSRWTFVCPRNSEIGH